jgi:hypothetical protein
MHDLAAAVPAARSAEALAMVIIRRVQRRAASPPDMLCELYGLTHAKVEWP